MTAVGWDAGHRTEVLQRQALPSLRERLRRAPRPVPAGAPRVPEGSPSGGSDDRPTLRQRLTGPGWPLALAFVPFPLWWVMGWTEIMPVAMGLIMGVMLLRRRRVEMPKGFGWWALYLVWSLAGLFVLGVPAYGAVVDSASTRIFTAAYRLVWYTAITLAGLYVLNTRREVPTRRVVRIFALMFIWVMAGGILGILAPNLQFSSLMELVLPTSVSRVPFVMHMIHPSAAQLMDVLGYASPRPSAPFAYTNTWGVNLAVLMPFFAAGWFGRGAGWRRYVAPVIAVLAVVAVIFSLNRGLWVALAVVAAFVAVRAGLQGRPGLIVGMTAAGLALAAVVVFSPLSGMVEARLSSAGSVQGRTNLSTLAVTSVAQTSPIIGLGSTRNVQGNFNSIAGGATVNCPRCSPPALGTQGQLWLVVFCQGFVGALLYLGFFAAAFLRNFNRRTPIALLGLNVIVLSTVTMPVYNSFGTGLMIVMVAIGLMAREERALPAGGVVKLRHSLSALGSVFAHHRALVLALTLLGLLGGAGWQLYNGVPQTASSTFLAPNDRATYPGLGAGLSTLDTQAQLLASPQVQDAVVAATNSPGGRPRGELTLTATPNSRVLHINYVSNDAADATAGSRAATAAFIKLDNSMVLAHRDQERAIVATSLTTLHNAFNQAYADLAATKSREGKTPRRVDTVTLSKRIDKAVVKLKNAQDALIRMDADQATLGYVMRQEPTKAQSSVWNISLTTGAWIGLLVGLLLAAWSDRRGGRLGRRALPALDEGVSYLGAVDLRRARSGRWRRRGLSPADLGPATTQLAGYGVTDTVLASSTAPMPEGTGPVAILATSRTPTRDVVRTRDALVSLGLPVRGVALA